MDRLHPEYTKTSMSKEQFFYAYKELAQKTEQHILLESGRAGKLCIAGVQPLVTLTSNDSRSLVFEWRDGTKEVKEGEPLELLSAFVQTMEMDNLPELPEFQGGAIGFVSYDYARSYEPIPEIAIDDLKTPDIFFYLFDRWAVLDLETEHCLFHDIAWTGTRCVRAGEGVGGSSGSRHRKACSLVNRHC